MCCIILLFMGTSKNRNTSRISYTSSNSCKEENRRNT